MPYKAIYQGEAKPPQSVPEHTDVDCPDCGGQMHVVKSHERQTGAFVSRHFRHNRNRASGGGGGGGRSCGESDEHIKLKSIAASKLEHIFEHNCWKCELEYTLEKTTTDADHRQADTLLLFDDLDEQLGQGVAVEVQYKNKDKDKHAVARDYIENNISVVWVTPDDFGEHDMRLNEADLRERARRAVWPEQVPGRREWWQPPHSPGHLRWIHNPAGFERRGSYDTRYNVNDRDVSVPATLTEMLVDELRYRESDWSALFADYPERHYRAQAAIPRVRSTTKVKASLLERNFDEHLYQSNRWHKKDNQLTYTENPEFVFGAVLPLEYLDSQLMDPVKNAPLPPDTPYDDVQCHNCGKYRYAPSAPMQCQSCGTWYNWGWNIQTGRVSPDNLPESVSL
jgi:ssDNA-binding Zn-finger/Zn-ribbon topoisomerase 1